MMKYKFQWAAMLGLLLPVALMPQISAGCSVADFQRLQWLCSDYQMAVKGYVVEGWFRMVHMPGMERFLESKLQIESGIHQIVLADGSVLSTSMIQKNNRWYIELQLISKHREQAVLYYSRWQQFADFYAPETPVGVTAISELSEPIDVNTSGQLVRELAEGLGLQTVSEIATEQYIQVSGYSHQLFHKICVNGIELNGSITAVPQGSCTYFYIASPVLYQQI